MEICQIENVRAELARRLVEPRDLAGVLDLDPRLIRHRIIGKTQWRVAELEITATYLGMSLDELIGRQATS